MVVSSTLRTIRIVVVYKGRTADMDSALRLQVVHWQEPLVFVLKRSLPENDFGQRLSQVARGMITAVRGASIPIPSAVYMDGA